jgi:hypothetical protein
MSTATCYKHLINEVKLKRKDNITKSQRVTHLLHTLYWGVYPHVILNLYLQGCKKEGGRQSKGDGGLGFLPTTPSLLLMGGNQLA